MVKMDTETVNHWGWFSWQLGAGEKDCEDEIMEEMLTDAEEKKTKKTPNTKIQPPGETKTTQQRKKQLHI